MIWNASDPQRSRIVSYYNSDRTIIVPGLCALKPDAIVETGTETSTNSGKPDGGYAFYVYWTR